MNTSYTDAGATAVDAVDGVVDVVVTGSVDITTAGTYTLPTLQRIPLEIQLKSQGL